MSAVSRTRRSKRARRAGYTLVEVMIAIAILTASSVAILALQEIVVHGNVTARQMTTATQIARTTEELLRVDALNWTQAGTTASVSIFGAGARFLRDVPSTASAAPGPWTRFGTAVGAIEHAYNYQGVPTAVSSDMVYCVEARYAWLYPGQALRADVRVYWPRSGPWVDASLYYGCPLQTGESSSYINNLHFVQTSTVLRYNPGPLP